jgi:hypothetical protein
MIALVRAGLFAAALHGDGRARVWRAAAAKPAAGDPAPAEWTDGRRDTFAALTPDPVDEVVRVGFEWDAPRPVAALEADFLVLGGEVFEPRGGSLRLEVKSADGWCAASGRLVRDDARRAELARFQEFGGVTWRVSFARCEALGVRLVLHRPRRDGAFGSYALRELVAVDDPAAPLVAIARGAVAAPIAGDPPPPPLDEASLDLAREPGVRRSHDGVGLVLGWPRARLVSEATLDARDPPAIDWWAGDGWRNVLVRSTETDVDARGEPRTTVRFVPHAVTRLRFVHADEGARLSVRLGERALADFEQMRRQWDDPLARQVAEAIGDPDYADAAAWLLPTDGAAAVLGRPDDPVETLVAWNGTLHETEHGDEGPWDAGAPAGAPQVAGSRARWTDRVAAFALDGELFGDDPDRATRRAAGDGRPGVVTRAERDGLVAYARAFVTAPGDVAWGTLVKVTLENERATRRVATFDAILARRAAQGDVFERAPRRSTFARDSDPRVLRAADGSIALFASPPPSFEPGDWETLAHWSCALGPQETRELTLFFPSVNAPVTAADALFQLDATRSRAVFESYWDGLDGACGLELPEAPLDELVRGLLAQCRIVLFDERGGGRGAAHDVADLTLKSGAYANEEYQGVEEGWPILALAQFGQVEAARRAVRRSVQDDLVDSDGERGFERCGVALARGCQVWRLAPDRDLLERLLPRLLSLADRIVAATAPDETAGGDDGEFAGLLRKRALGGGAGTARSLADVALAWRGLEEVARLAADVGVRPRAAQLAKDADDLRARLLRAAEQFTERAADPPFVPMAVDVGASRDAPDWRRAEEPHPFLGDDPLGDAWSRSAALALESGAFDPRRPPATWIRQTLERHGGQWLGLARRRAALDPARGFGAIAQLADTGFDADASQFRSAAFAFLAHGLARDVFTGGEVAGVLPLRTSNVALRERLLDARWDFGLYGQEPAGDDHGRALGSEPQAAAAGIGLLLIRRMLIEETGDGEPVADPAATPEVLHLLRLAPPRWFGDGKRLRFDGLPTVFGPVSLEVHSRIDEGVVRGRIQVGGAAGPRRDGLPLRRIVLWVRSPDGTAIRGARFDGEPLTSVHEDSIELPVDRGGEFEITY